MRYYVKAVLLTLCAVAVVLAGSASAFAQMKIGYIRPQYIFSQYEPYKNAINQLGEYEKQVGGSIQEEYNILQKDVQDAEKQAAMMTDEMRAQKGEEFGRRQQDIQQKMDELYREDPQNPGTLAKKRDELIQPVIDNINKVLMRIGEEQGYDYIFDAEQGLLYAKDEYDLSDSVLEELRKGNSAQ